MDGLTVIRKFSLAIGLLLYRRTEGTLTGFQLGMKVPEGMGARLLEGMHLLVDVQELIHSLVRGG